MVLVAGKMYRPTDVAIDIATNSVYVVEHFNHRISKWDYTNGNYDFTLDVTWGNNGDGTTGQAGPIISPTDNNLDHPTGIVFDGTNLYVTDTFHNRLRVIDPSDGSFLTSVGSKGSRASQFYRPAGIAINPGLTTIVIADEFNHRAVRYTVGNPPTSPAVLPNTTPLALNRPHGVIYDINNNFFDVTDSVRSIINRYNNLTTSFVSQIGVPGTTDTDLFYPSSGHGLLNGTTTTVFADTRNSSLKTVVNETIAVNVLIPGTGDGELYYPESVTSIDDGLNYVLISNTLNNRVEAFSNVATTLNFETNFGSP